MMFFFKPALHDSFGAPCRRILREPLRLPRANCLKKKHHPGILLLILLATSLPSFSQISLGGLPASFGHHVHQIPEINIPGPDLNSIRTEDIEEEKQGLPRRVAVAVRAGINPSEQGRWSNLPDGGRAWTVELSCDGALALGFFFDDFKMTPGAQLFIYNEDRSVILGAFTQANNKPHRLFSTGLIPGDKAILELNMDAAATELPALSVSEISYLYRDMPDFLEHRGPSDACEVNINCPEGDAWQKQKRGITRIYVKRLSSFFWCTGSLVNNTSKDLTPYLLTADHCAPDVSQTDLSQWIFYFNFEAPGCENPVTNPVPVSLSGAVKLANASTSGSDFLLVQLDDEVPLSYGPFFNGWSAEGVPSPNGVTIHHPNGDIRKISTFTQAVTSSQWSSIPGTHWEVFWAATQTNWGVTEGGSSGAPLFDNNGKIIGTLTGGMAACDPGGSGPGTGPDKPDYYGKFSYSWDQNGTDPSRRLQPWLDPGNTGVTSLAGMNSVLTASFEANEQIILTGNRIKFTNLSSGLPISWEWTFEGGNPAAFSGPEPPEVTYSAAGTYDVGLIVSDGEMADTLYYTDYIQVVGQVYPNPVYSHVNIYLEEELPAPVKIEVYNLTGQKVYETENSEQVSRIVTVDLSGLSAGVYTIRIQVRQRFVFAKVIKVER